ncbi:glycosyltransferase family 1 protein [Brumimicrobium glaciale]|uniref:Glycosyltransferase family 1 protein n=1 Tax=Brumimicrobium glaciale TaxID=200475 RepID=A0A4Q4KJE8_9FLAO|nr:glycosyltransferase family 4 protein [Brumimicrobium glaciale]RYM33463.1 glycosyltransferase family 1 protein [Brumimicrobium glaciale]
MSLKKISIFCPITLPYKSGAGQNAYNLAKALKDHNHEVRIISFNLGSDAKKEIIGGIEIYRIPINTKNKITKAFSYFSIFPAFIKHLKISDLSIIFGPLQGYTILILIGKILNNEVVFRSTMFGKDDITTLNNKFGPGLYKFRKHILSKMGGYISQSPAMTESIVNEYGSKIPILESAQGVNTEVFFPLSEEKKQLLKEELGLPKNKINIISVGYVIERKGYREVFEALNSIKNEVDFQFLIIGNFNPDKDHYMYYLKNEMKEIYNYGNSLLNDRIKFLGESNEVDKYLKASDIFVLNSVMEGMPNVLLEAMACGLPSVVKSMKGVDDYITKKNINSLIVNDTNALALGLKKLIKDEKMQIELGENAAHFIQSKFSISKISLDIIKKFKKS